MAARGSKSKEDVMKKILEVFSGSFAYEKELRIPVIEDGELIQIKVTLTAAKTNVDNPNEKDSSLEEDINDNNDKNLNFINEPTEEEKRKVEELCIKLNLK